eukprot:TRINITY_DN5_c113_g3_i1.p5 TRINITY_DN5_c113_g3~~TRINITY_DN5_c113_g3_i1.p5  ORF type:complete len:149 (+),score=10.00 TRINITY_DN5_c113_g3_i1:675-1121(+)
MQSILCPTLFGSPGYGLRVRVQGKAYLFQLLPFFNYTGFVQHVTDLNGIYLQGCWVGFFLCFLQQYYNFSEQIRFEFHVTNISSKCALERLLARVLFVQKDGRKPVQSDLIERVIRCRPGLENNQIIIKSDGNDDQYSCTLSQFYVRQ